MRYLILLPLLAGCFAAWPRSFPADPDATGTGAPVTQDGETRILEATTIAGRDVRRTSWRQQGRVFHCFWTPPGGDGILRLQVSRIGSHAAWLRGLQLTGGSRWELVPARQLVPAGLLETLTLCLDAPILHALTDGDARDARLLTDDGRQLPIALHVPDLQVLMSRSDVDAKIYAPESGADARALSHRHADRLRSPVSPRLLVATSSARETRIESLETRTPGGNWTPLPLDVPPLRADRQALPLSIPVDATHARLSLSRRGRRSGDWYALPVIQRELREQRVEVWVR